MIARAFRTASLSVAALALASCAHAPEEPSRGSMRSAAPVLTLRLDRVPLAVRDFEKTTRHYQRNLGFHLEKIPDRAKGFDAHFKDGSSLRLVPDGDPGDEHSRQIRIRVSDWDLLMAKIKGSSLRYGESGRENDKRLEILAPAALERIAFVPEPVAAAATATDPHANTAGGLTEAWLAVDDLDEAERELRDLDLGPVEDAVLQPLRARAVHLVLDGGRLVFVQRGHLEPRALEHLGLDGSRLAGVSIGIRDLEGANRFLKRTGKVRHAIARYNGKSCLILAPKSAGGVFLELVKTPYRVF